MPSAVPQVKPLEKWHRPGKTTYNLPWADLSVIDLSTFDEPGGKEALATQLRDAVHRDGFFSVIGHGFTEEEIERQFSIGQAFFAQPLEEKSRAESRCNFDQGNYFGYRAPFERTVMGTDVLDNVESINIPKFIPELENEPHHPFLKPFEAEIEDFSRRSWEVARKVMVLCAIVLEIPEDFFVSRHLYESKSDDHLRYMMYRKRRQEDDIKVQNTWARSHTDFGSLTLLWSQNVVALQIRTHQGDWKYVRPIDGSIVCNIADTLSFWSAGYLKSTIHRVVRPPPDQDNIDRLGLLYFVRPANDADIVPAPSPLLKRLGLVTEEEQHAEPVKGLEYVRSRVKEFHNRKDLNSRPGEKLKVGNLEVELEVI
ncbi:MAG: hypothetical protein M1834_002450 [Cirrosporium novae-zelandiae]|nr:MAG: hypothetical protein M1834_002450 [Cirrosporium novae-zelandiae]